MLKARMMQARGIALVKAFSEGELLREEDKTGVFSPLVFIPFIPFLAFIKSSVSSYSS
jgi:hypothetical protein